MLNGDTKIHITYEKYSWEFPWSISPSCFLDEEFVFLGKASPWQLPAPICQQTPSPWKHPGFGSQGPILTPPQAAGAPLEWSRLLEATNPHHPLGAPRPSTPLHQFRGGCWRFNGGRCIFRPLIKRERRREQRKPRSTQVTCICNRSLIAPL